MKVSTFIFNWPTKENDLHRKTAEKIRQLKDIKLDPIVINSDEAYNFPEPHQNLGNDAYFTAQFTKAMEIFFTADADVLFHIQADASYHDWETLLKDAARYKQKYNWGIYAPNVDYTWYDSSRTDINSIQIEEKNLKVVACPDCTCWFIDRKILEDYIARKIDMSPYKMGWGWDLIFPSLSFLRRMPVLRDYNHTISHPPGTNYNKHQAQEEMYALFASLPEDLKSLFYFIKTEREEIARLFGAQ